jgi:hypothetical protein
MYDQAAVITEDFLASTADLVGLLAQFSATPRRGSSQRRREELLAQAALSNLFQGDGPTHQQQPMSPAIPEMSRVTAPRQMADERAVAVTVQGSVPTGTKHGHSGVRRRLHRECGVCKWCQDNARWDRIFTEKFADPTYYSGPVVRHRSSLAGARIQGLMTNCQEFGRLQEITELRREQMLDSLPRAVRDIGDRLRRIGRWRYEPFYSQLF